MDRTSSFLVIHPVLTLSLQLCPVGQKSKKPAVFTTAAVWRWSTDLDTGNYVPEGETAPEKLLEARV